MIYNMQCIPSYLVFLNTASPLCTSLYRSSQPTNVTNLHLVADASVNIRQVKVIILWLINHLSLHLIIKPESIILKR